MTRFRPPSRPRPLRGAFAAGLLLAALALPAAAESGVGESGASEPGGVEQPDPVQQVRAALYHALMAEILLTGVATASEGARWSIGEVNPYPALSGDKVIAACINWENTTPGAIDWYGYTFYYDQGRPQPSDDPATLDRLAGRALDSCRQYESMSDCFCQVVDRNDRNALALPEWFRRSRLPGPAPR